MGEKQLVDKKLQSIAVDILDMIAEGNDEQEVCDSFSIRRGTLIQWIIKYPEFEEAMKNAKRMRADSYRTMVHKSVKDQIVNPLSKDEVPGDKLIFDKLKWLASVDDPDKYGTKIKHDGNLSAPVQIVVDTGIKVLESLDAKDDGILKGIILDAEEDIDLL